MPLLRSRRQVRRMRFQGNLMLLLLTAMSMLAFAGVLVGTLVFGW
jgi:hypothetical protein